MNDINRAKINTEGKNAALPRLSISVETNTENVEITTFKVFKAGRHHLRAPMHNHPVHGIEYVYKGSIHYEMSDGSEIQVNAGECILVQAHVFHKYECESAETEKLFVGFELETGDQWFNEFLNKSAVPVKVSDEIIRLLAESIQKELLERHYFSKKSAAFLSNAFIFRILEAALTQNGFINMKEMERLQEDARIRDLRQFIDQRIFNGISPEMVAKHLGLELRQANRVCKEHFGQTISQLIVSTRIQRINRMLISTDYSLTEISEMMGFSSVYSFIRHYKHYTRNTPAAFRREAKIYGNDTLQDSLYEED